MVFLVITFYTSKQAIKPGVFRAFTPASRRLLPVFPILTLSTFITVK
jgi:hypothetical protein